MLTGAPTLSVSSSAILISTPTVDSIKNCTSKTDCGQFILGPPSVTITNTISTKFVVGTVYTLYFVCYNRVYKATKSSNLVKSYSFTFYQESCPTGQVLQNGNCVGSSTISNGTSTSTNSSSSGNVTNTTNTTIVTKGVFSKIQISLIVLFVLLLI